MWARSAKKYERVQHINICKSNHIVVEPLVRGRALNFSKRIIISEKGQDKAEFLDIRAKKVQKVLKGTTLLWAADKRSTIEI